MGVVLAAGHMPKATTDCQSLALGTCSVIEGIQPGIQLGTYFENYLQITLHTNYIRYHLGLRSTRPPCSRMFVHFTVWSEIGSVVRSRTVGVCVNMGQRLITSYEGHASLRQDAYLSGCVTGRVSLLYPGGDKDTCASVLTPFLTFWGLNTNFGGTFSRPATPKRSFWGIKTTNPYRIRSFWPQIPFSLNLLGSNFQRPAAHPRGHTSIGFRTEKLMIKEYFACNFD